MINAVHVSKLVYLILMLLPMGARAQVNACAEAFNDAKLMETERVPRSAPSLIGTSNTYDPFAAVKQNKLYPLEGYVHVEIDTNNGQVTQSAFLSYRDPLSGAQASVASMDVHDQGLASVYKAYENVLSDQIIAEVKETEKVMPVSRTLTYSIARPEAKEPRGFIRVFDGTVYPRWGGVEVSKFHSDPRLPLEHVLSVHGRKVEAVNVDRQNGLSIFEIGKVMIAKDASLRERLEVRKMMIRWFKIHVIDQEREDKTVFYADVESEAHREAYQRWFGFKVIEDPNLNGQVKPPAYMLRVELKDLKQYLNKN